MAYREFRVVEIPEGVEVEVDGKVVRVRGPLGQLERDFSHAPVGIRLEDGRVKVGELPLDFWEPLRENYERHR